MRDSNTPLSAQDRANGPSLGKEAGDLDTTINRVTLVDIQQVLHPIIGKSTFSSACGVCTEIAPKVSKLHRAETLAYTL